MQLIFSAPLSTLSLGQVSYNLLREMWKRDYQVAYFPIGKIDLTAFQPDPKFSQWLQKSVDQRLYLLRRDIQAVRLWHINGSESFVGPKQKLVTYYECSEPTELEKTIVALQDRVLFSSKVACDHFKDAGLTNVDRFAPGFDEDFHSTGKKYLEGRIHWLLAGKAEFRKATKQIAQNWIKKYANNPKHSLSLLINNPFFSPEDNQKILADIFQGRKPWNVNILPHLATNAEINELTNSVDVDLSGLSQAEGTGLPAFNATCLGKWSIVGAHTGHLDWATVDNCILVKPDGKRRCNDDWFFNKDSPVNQGEFYTMTDDTMIDAFERAEKKVGTTNINGLTLGQTMTYSKTLDQILSHV